MDINKVKTYLESYELGGDNIGLPLSAFYGFEKKEGKLHCYLVDSAEPVDSDNYRYGFYCEIEVKNKYYIITVSNKKERYKNKEIYHSRKEIAEMLEAEVV